MNAARPLCPAQRTNAEASVKVCVGPIAEVLANGRYKKIKFRMRPRSEFGRTRIRAPLLNR